MRDPLHGITLKALLESLIDRHGWDALARAVPVRCFQNEPTLNSSLKFLRKTPWARAKVEAFYLQDVARTDKNRKRNQRRADRRAFATLPVEAEERLGLSWPPNTKVPRLRIDREITLELGVDRAGFTDIHQAVGRPVSDALWDGLQLLDDGMAVAYVDDEPVGVVCALHRQDGWVELAELAVDPAHRGRGIGRAVCSKLLRALQTTGQRQVFATASDADIHALTIAIDLGFRPVERDDKRARWEAVHLQLAELRGPGVEEPPPKPDRPQNPGAIPPPKPW